MSTRILALPTLVLSFFYSASLIGQQTPASAVVTGAEEFPVILQQGITAGKTPVGTKIQARLGTATLVNGAVVPRNAVFSGEVTVSSAKTKTDPSRLAVRMDTVQWKSGSAPVKVYLTAWYYPTHYETGQTPEYGPQKPATRTWNGAGTYPDPNSSDTYKPFPHRRLRSRFLGTEHSRGHHLESPHPHEVCGSREQRGWNDCLGVESLQSQAR